MGFGCYKLIQFLLLPPLKKGCLLVGSVRGWTQCSSIYRSKFDACVYLDLLVYLLLLSFVGLSAIAFWVLDHIFSYYSM